MRIPIPSKEKILDLIMQVSVQAIAGMKLDYQEYIKGMPSWAPIASAIIIYCGIGNPTISRIWNPNIASVPSSIVNQTFCDESSLFGSSIGHYSSSFAATIFRKSMEKVGAISDNASMEIPSSIFTEHSSMQIALSNMMVMSAKMPYEKVRILNLMLASVGYYFSFCNTTFAQMIASFNLLHAIQEIILSTSDVENVYHKYKEKWKKQSIVKPFGPMASLPLSSTIGKIIAKAINLKRKFFCALEYNALSMSIKFLCSIVFSYFFTIDGFCWGDRAILCMQSNIASTLNSYSTAVGEPKITNQISLPLPNAKHRMGIEVK